MSRTLRGLALLTASCAVLWVAVPGFLAACVQDPTVSEPDCPRSADCEIEGHFVDFDANGNVQLKLVAGVATTIECRVDLTVPLDEARVERELASSARPIAIDALDVVAWRSHVDLGFTVPADGEDWQSLEVALDFEGCDRSIEANLGGFPVLAEWP